MGATPMSIGSFETHGEQAGEKKATSAFPGQQTRRRSQTRIPRMESHVFPTQSRRQLEENAEFSLIPHILQVPPLVPAALWSERTFNEAGSVGNRMGCDRRSYRHYSLLPS